MGVRSEGAGPGRSEGAGPEGAARGTRRGGRPGPGTTAGVGEGHFPRAPCGKFRG